MTDDQLIDKLRTVVREEVEAETKKTESDNFFSNIRIGKLITELKNSVKDLKISNSRLEKGLDVVKAEQKAQGKTISGINKTLDDHGKTLKYIKNKLNKTAKTVDIIGLRYDERIVENSRRVDRIEDHLGLPQFKAKQ